jgi:AraC-like DNA-binding protein
MVPLRSLIQRSASTDECCCQSRRARAVEHIRLLEQFLEQSPAFPITLSHVADFLSLEKTYCCKVFREITGQLFSDWIRRIRINKAQALLHLSAYSITNVAYAVGYPDITTFERNFRKELGVCPTSFRRVVPNASVGVMSVSGGQAR